MDRFLQYFFQDIGRVFRAFFEIITAFFNFLNYLLNFPMRYKIIKEYSADFSVLEWVMLIITEIVITAIIVIAFYWFFRFLRKVLRFGGVPAKKYDEMVKQMRNLQRDLLRANYEKDRLLQMKAAQLDVHPSPEDVEEESDEYTPKTNRNTRLSPCVDPTESRFFRLTSVDNFYKTEYIPPEYNNDISLDELCEKFRAYAANEMKLYYDTNMIRYFIASMGAARIIILQGISGTGKTSLPYAFGKFIQKDTSIISVQPSWRERTEIYGYYNEFTKKYTETDFLRAVYEANYFRDPHILILDEMNIAHIEYYFAEMLSLLELPQQSDWKIDVVTATWDNDPCLIENGEIQVSDNVWFVGTINNDDSTFAVSDKVYDRAIPIDLDSRAEPFECEHTDPVHISTDHLNELFAKAKADYPVSEDMIEKLEALNIYLIKNFRLAFGNRILKHINEFVPCFIACGGTEQQAIDFIIAKKVLRKFESLSLTFMKDELTRFNTYLDKLFGKNKMSICKEYVEYLKKNN